MGSYYTGWRARHYNICWRSFTKRTLAETVAMIDVAKLQNIASQMGRPPRVLDVACGTGVLLSMLIELIPDVEAYGVDASTDMLVQARLALRGQLHVQLERARLGDGETAHLPYAPQSFDLITCTNALHDMSNPVGVLAELGRLLAPEGQLIVEDYARHGPPFLWALFEWLARRIEGGHEHAYTLSEAQALCMQAGLCVVCEHAFTLDWLWHGWVLRLSVVPDR